MSYSQGGWLMHLGSTGGEQPGTPDYGRFASPTYFPPGLCGDADEEEEDDIIQEWEDDPDVGDLAAALTRKKKKKGKNRMKKPRWSRKLFRHSKRAKWR